MISGIVMPPEQMKRDVSNMKVQKYFFIFLITCIMLLAAGCGGETAINTGTAVAQETGTDENEEIGEEIQNDEQSIAEITGWQAAVGEWEDENDLGYTMRVSENETKTDMLFSISFPKIKRNGPVATVMTEISYWFVNQGGSPAGSVYSVVIIDVSNGDVLSADVTA